MSDQLDAIVVHNPAELEPASVMSLSYKGMWYFLFVANLGVLLPQKPVSKAGELRKETDIR